MSRLARAEDSRGVIATPAISRRRTAAAAADVVVVVVGAAWLRGSHGPRYGARRRNSPRPRRATATATTRRPTFGRKSRLQGTRRDSPSECCKRPEKSSFRRVQQLPFTTLSLSALPRPAETAILPGARTRASAAPRRAGSKRPFTERPLTQGNFWPVPRKL